MKLVSTQAFDDDIKRLDGSLKQRLKKAVRKIVETPQLGKPLQHFPNYFSERIGHFRLIYHWEKAEITLTFFKKRDEIYPYLDALK